MSRRLDQRRPEAARTYASLCPGLLARKGGARPAMRPQPQADRFGTASGVDPESDLGWNDFGDDAVPAPAAAEPGPSRDTADVVPIGRDAGGPAAAAVPTIARRPGAATARSPRRAALAAGRKAAFTLRLDAERHLKLRLACTIDARSAQQLVTEALDRLLADMPDIAALAARVGHPAKS